jgi:hypothetical protein
VLSISREENMMTEEVTTEQKRIELPQMTEPVKAIFVDPRQQWLYVINGRAQADVFSLRDNAVRVRHFIGVAEHQGLAVGQAQDHQRAAGLVFTNGGDCHARRQRQVNALEFGTRVNVEEQRLALVGNPHGDLVLLLHGDHQGLAGVLHPGRRQGVFLGQRGTVEQRGNHIAKEEEDQGNGTEDGEAANPSDRISLRRNADRAG